MSQQAMNLSESSMMERAKHEEMLLELKAKERAATLTNVPTLPQEVRSALRQMGLPVRLFGENLANVRARLRLAMARQDIVAPETEKKEEEAKTVEEQKETKYTRASEELVQARKHIAKYSLRNARKRLEREHKLRLAEKQRRKSNIDGGEEDNMVTDDLELTKRMDEECVKLYKSINSMTLQGSQYGDERPLSAIASLKEGSSSLVATGAWSGSVKLWDGSSSQLDLLAHVPVAHEDRITGISMTDRAGTTLIATASIDLTGKLFKVIQTASDASEPSSNYAMEQVSELKGHAARLCKVAFHPTHDYVGTTSFDHTWRLWDVEANAGLLLLQDGHWKETYGIGFHIDGSLCATTDLGGVVQVWDLRTGRSIIHYAGHAKRVLCSEFAPNGFHLATAGDDGTLKVWDLRNRRTKHQKTQKPLANIPAHSNLISQIKFDNETIVSASFDGTAKVWSARDYKMLASLRGHEGKIMGVDIVGAHGGIVTSGYDKTIKYWQ